MTYFSYPVNQVGVVLLPAQLSIVVKRFSLLHCTSTNKVVLKNCHMRYSALLNIYIDVTVERFMFAIKKLYMPQLEVWHAHIRAVRE